ncbi:hypothetical protein A2715_01845 [Candidatus Woesebacteria bacterium RIFCSPHIGHO2_01_FULL_39_32]|uniref:Uncharacterized protein n=2 Tax=Candidatus Woeseibacteriota TaxID=1752722 RepID=A0A0G0S7V4_9BACT|nr:MAG: hypothetical protein UT61_C0001G0009 [Candidatus Woesebacteria bacterium GW2011_GWA1_39_8]OGM03634.1 MAG: hypothetical protein A2124_00550 [Candidatus Woesebacteria bacterium GWB1_37_5]OGM23901.1 MAG: hypothetical protein A2715_01845 [Candidatus Woesebacteria bacterium RIFCSPHIGHO2_01_FULL_39_32]OGM38635.1 MAG: hypothetical protein A3F01_02685 [Candidatus Woesebacteria bacterium RIFCSPHIGHO2_12_FULL_38_11]OGM64090.1 MAG: hypothetical protein A2893_03085 [Candidatus Woesebacteria bacteri
MSTEIDNRRQIPILVDLEQEVHPSSPVGTSVSSESIPFIETITPPEPIVFQESRSDKPDPSTLTNIQSMEGATRYLTSLYTPKGGSYDIQTTDPD